MFKNFFKRLKFRKNASLRTVALELDTLNKKRWADLFAAEDNLDRDDKQARVWLKREEFHLNEMMTIAAALKRLAKLNNS